MKLKMIITHSLELVLIDVINHLIELVHEVLPHLISDLLTVLDLVGLHISVLASCLGNHLLLFWVVDYMDVTVFGHLHLALAMESLKLLFNMLSHVNLVLHSRPLLLDLLQLGQLLVDLDLLLDLQLLLQLDLLIGSAPLSAELH